MCLLLSFPTSPSLSAAFIFIIKYICSEKKCIFSKVNSLYAG